MLTAALLGAAVLASAAAPQSPPALSPRLALGLSATRRGMLGFKAEQRWSLEGALGIDLRLSRSVGLSLDVSQESSSVPTPGYLERSRSLFVIVGPEFREKWFYWRLGAGLVHLDLRPEAAGLGRTRDETAPAVGLTLGREIARESHYRVALETQGRLRTAGGMALRAATLGLRLVGRWGS